MTGATVPRARPVAVPQPLRVLVVDDEAPAREELAWLLARDPRVGRVRSAGERRRGAARARRRAGRRRVLRHPDARPRRAGPRAGARPVRRAAAGRVRDRLRRARASTRSTCRPPTTCSSRSGPSGWRRPSAGWSGRRGRAGDDAAARTAAEPDDETIAGRARPASPGSCSAPGALRRGAGRLRPAAHGDQQPPGPDAAHHARGALGGRRLRPHPPQPRSWPLAARRRDARRRRPLHACGSATTCCR